MVVGQPTNLKALLKYPRGSTATLHAASLCKSWSRD